MAKRSKRVAKPDLVGETFNIYIYQAALYCEDDGNLIS